MPDNNDRTVQTAQEVTKELIERTVHETLFQIGVMVDDNEDVVEFRKDMAHLRKWRVAVEKVESRGLLAAVGVVVSGLFAILWVGYQSMFGPH